MLSAVVVGVLVAAFLAVAGAGAYAVRRLWTSGEVPLAERE